MHTQPSSTCQQQQEKKREEEKGKTSSDTTINHHRVIRRGEYGFGKGLVLQMVNGPLERHHAKRMIQLLHKHRTTELSMFRVPQPQPQQQLQQNLQQQHPPNKHNNNIQHLSLNARMLGDALPGKLVCKLPASLWRFRCHPRGLLFCLSLLRPRHLSSFLSLCSQYYYSTCLVPLASVAFR